MSRLGPLLLCGAVVVAGPGCGLLSRHHHPAADTAEHRRIAVAIQSHNWNDITVYLVTGGLPQRLGMVTALSQATFEFPSQRLNTSGGVRLRALPVAGRPFTSETILVQPGQMITWILENDLDASSLTVY